MAFPRITPGDFDARRANQLNSILAELGALLRMHAHPPLSVALDPAGVRLWLDLSAGTGGPLLLDGPVIDLPIPVTLTTDKNDYDFGQKSSLNITPTNDISLTGLVFPAYDGQIVTLYNDSPTKVITLPNLSASSTSGGRIQTPSGNSVKLRPKKKVTLKYKGTPGAGVYVVQDDPPPDTYDDPVTFNDDATFNDPVTFTDPVTLTNETIKGLVQLKDTSNGGPALVYFDTETSGDPTTEFVLPGTNEDVPVSAPSKPGLLGQWNLDAYPVLYHATASSAASDWKRVLEVDYEASATWDPGNIANGSLDTTTVAVTGAVMGDFVLASFDQDHSKLVLSAYVSAADTVTAVMLNNSGGAVNLGSGTLRVRVLKH
jgi:hypothetical protein